MGSPSRYDRSSQKSRSRSATNRPERRYSRSRSPPRHRRDSRSPPRRRDSRSPPRRRRNSPPPRQRRDDDRGSNRRDFKKENGGGGNKKYDWGRPEDNVKVEEEPVEKVEPNFGLSGKLAAETNTVKGVELKYNEPAEAAKPSTKWRLYVFKGDEQIGKIKHDYTKKYGMQELMHFWLF
jgi:smad nuclear-interacting protein 1